jgi:hypothetical protein
MSAVSKKLMPASREAFTAAALAAASIRHPKLLQPRPTTDTSKDPIRRVSNFATSRDLDGWLY